MSAKSVKNVKKETAILGRPTKCTPELEKTLLEAVATGAPYKIACHAAGISEDTFIRWRYENPEFARKVEIAAGKTALEIMKRIRQHGEESFQPLAWMMERRYPDCFGRPEVQLNMGLQVNGQQINNTLVISAEVAEKLEKRARKMTAEVDALIEAQQAKRQALYGADNLQPSRTEPRVIETEVVSNQITLPPEAQRTPFWWRQLSRGDGMRVISYEAAIHAIETVTVKVFGIGRASRMQIEFDDSQPKLRDVHAAIEQICGPKGWEALVELGE
jgi:hypothetical protein